MNSTLPKSWELTQIKYICDIQGGYSFKSKDYKDKGIPLLRISNIKDGKISFEKNTVYLDESVLKKNEGFLLNRGDIVIALSGATTGKYGKYTLDNVALLNQRVGRIRYKNVELVNQNYIYYYLRIIRNSILKEAYGAAQPNISTRELADFDIPLPPLPEQHRIVAKIEELFTKLDAGVMALKEAQKLLKRYRKSVLKAAVEGRLTAQWREQHKHELEPANKLLERIQAERKAKLGKKYKEPKPVDTTDLPELPEGWGWVKLKSISQALGGYAFKSKDYTQTGYQIIKIGNIKTNLLNLRKNPSFIANPNIDIVKKYSLMKNDILITLTGTRRKRDYGFVAIVKDEKNLLLNQRVARLRFSLKVNPYYFLISLQNEEFRNRLFANETGNVGQGNIGMGAITNEPIPLPPIKEQNKIVEEYERLFSIIDETEQVIESELKRAQSLRQSILKRAFEGKLVPQDPNDEPASLLIERIKAQKAK